MVTIHNKLKEQKCCFRTTTVIILLTVHNSVPVAEVLFSDNYSNYLTNSPQ